MIRIVSAVAVAGLGLLTPALAAAPDTKALWADMEKVDGVFGSRGFDATAWEKQGEIATGGHYDLPLRLDASKTYNVIALCGADCSNLDMELISPSGMMVGSDTAADKTPIAGITPPVSGDYTVRIVMAGCSANPCAFVTKAFVKR